MTSHDRVLVCGGRNFHNVNVVRDVLDRLHRAHNFSLLITGGARGADTTAFRWATGNGIESYTYPAKWNTYGKKAGPVRNKRMLTHGRPDLVVAFPGGRGTAHMVELAHRHGVEVVEVDASGEPVLPPVGDR